MNTREYNVTVRGYAVDSSRAIAVVHVHDSGRRVRRAVAGLGVCWALAIVFVFIPVAHFVLVPGAVLTGVVVATRRLGRRDRLGSMTGSCPDCGVEQDFQVGDRWSPPFSVSCAQCARGLTLSV